MYKVALSVAACLRANTRVDVAWPVWSDALPIDPGTDTVAFTPGGGKVGGMFGGVLDGQLRELVDARRDNGRLVEVAISEVDAAIAGLPHGGRVRCALVPATALPAPLWSALQAREPVCIVSQLDGEDLVVSTVLTGSGLDQAPPEIATLLREGASTVATVDDRIVTVLWPVPQLVVNGGGPVADALREAGRVVGWQVVVEPDPEAASGLIAALSDIDSVVVIGHDLETSGRALAAALESPAGYIGALGSHRMQQQRADWLAYRGITDLDRVHGPAGFDIGARSAGEIAIAIVAEAVAAHRTAS